MGCDLGTAAPKTEESLQKCVDESPLAKDLRDRYERGESRDMHHHELDGFEDLEEWCYCVCKSRSAKR